MTFIERMIAAGQSRRLKCTLDQLDDHILRDIGYRN